MAQINRRPILVNLDPANDNIPYIPDIDLADLISLDGTSLLPLYSQVSIYIMDLI